MSHTPASAAYYAGYRSYEKGVPLRSNPFPKKTQEHADWIQGWKEAKTIYG